MEDIGRHFLELRKKGIVILGNIGGETVVISLANKAVPGPDERDLLTPRFKRRHQRIGNGIAAMEQKPAAAMFRLCRWNRRKVPAFRNVPVVGIFLPGKLDGGFFRRIPGLRLAAGARLDPVAILGKGIGRQGHAAPTCPRQSVPIQRAADGPDVSSGDKRQRHIVIGLFRWTAGGNHG